MKRDYPFYLYSSYYPEEDPKGLPVCFRDTWDSNSILTPGFNMKFSNMHPPSMGYLRVIPREPVSATVYYPRALDGEIKFGEFGEVPPGGSFHIEEGVELTVLQKEQEGFPDEGGQPLPIIWVFERDGFLMSRVQVATYYTPEEERHSRHEGDEYFEDCCSGWDLPLYHFMHPAALDYMVPLAWLYFTEGEKEKLLPVTYPFGMWNEIDGKFFCSGIFHRISHLLSGNQVFMPYNYTAEDVSFFWHGPKGCGFNDGKGGTVKELKMRPQERALHGVTAPHETPQLLVSVGETRVEYIPYYVSREFRCYEP